MGQTLTAFGLPPAGSSPATCARGRLLLGLLQLAVGEVLPALAGEQHGAAHGCLDCSRISGSQQAVKSAWKELLGSIGSFTAPAPAFSANAMRNIYGKAHVMLHCIAIVTVCEIS
jgi:hypothetical protein